MFNCNIISFSQVKSLQEKGNKAARAKDHSSALRYFSEALDIDQGNVGVLHDRSLVLLQMGRYNEARVDAEAVIMMSPGYSQVGLIVSTPDVVSPFGCHNLILCATFFSFVNTPVKYVS